MLNVAEEQFPRREKVGREMTAKLNIFIHVIKLNENGSEHTILDDVNKKTKDS